MAPKDKKGGSVLGRLKSNLKGLGLLGNAQRNKQSDKKFDSKRDKMTAIKQRVNPFERKVNKQKHQVLNRQQKGSQGRPTVAHGKALEQRKQTLLLQYKQQGRHSQFQDRRFGEQDAVISVEEKMQQRFAQERQSRYNLDDNAASGDLFGDDEDGGLLGEKMQLTHDGQSFNELGDRQLRGDRYTVGSDDEENQVPGLDRHITADHHFGGFDREQPEGGKKTFKDVMSEVIAKSKYYKDLRQREKNENEDLREQLDADLDAVRGTLLQASNKHSVVAAVKADDYDMMVRELAAEKKARPTDRLQTEEEQAQYAADRLRAMEEKRLARQLGTFVSDGYTANGGGGDSLEENFALGEFDAAPQQNAAQHNALIYGDGKLLNPQDMVFKRALKRQEAEAVDDVAESDGSDANSITSCSDVGSADSDDEALTDCGADDVAVLGDELEAVTSTESEYELVESDVEHATLDEQSVGVKTDSIINKTVPFTFAMPTSKSEISTLLNAYEPAQFSTVIDRLKTLHHPQLKAGNKEKLATLTLLLLEYYELKIKNLVRHPNQQLIAVNEIVKHLSVIICGMAKSHNESVTKFCRDRLTMYHKRFMTQRCAHEAGTGRVDGLVKLHEFYMVSFMAHMYSLSDFQHAVGTPLQLLVGEWLAGLRLRVKTVGADNDRCTPVIIGDCAMGLALSQMFIQCQTKSIRFMPEVVAFLFECLDAMVGHASAGSATYFLRDATVNRRKCLETDVADVASSAKPVLSDVCTGKFENVAVVKRQLLIAALGTVAQLATMYAQRETVITKPNAMAAGGGDSLEDDTTPLSAVFVNVTVQPGWPWQEVFEPIIQLLHSVSSAYGDVATTLRTMLLIQQDITARRLQTCRRLGAVSVVRMPLQLHAAKSAAKTTKSLAPKFHERFDPDRHYSATQDDHAHQEARKMQALHRRELKGALRELKRDAAYLAGEKLSATARTDNEYSRKIKRVYGMIGNEVSGDKRQKNTQQ